MNHASRKVTHETTFQIGETSVILKAVFSFVPGYPATGQSYASGGEPACAAEVDVHSLDWSLDNPITKTVQWHSIDGALFELISEDGELYCELCEAAENEDR